MALLHKARWKTFTHLAYGRVKGCIYCAKIYKLKTNSQKKKIVLKMMFVFIIAQRSFKKLTDRSEINKNFIRLHMTKMKHWLLQKHSFDKLKEFWSGRHLFENGVVCYFERYLRHKGIGCFLFVLCFAIKPPPNNMHCIVINGLMKNRWKIYFLWWKKNW